MNCLNMSLKPRTGTSDLSHKLLILLEMQHTDGVHAFKMADKIAKKEGSSASVCQSTKTSQKLPWLQYIPLK